MEDAAVYAAQSLIYSCAEYGFHEGNWISPDAMPTAPLRSVAQVVWEQVTAGVKKWGNIVPAFGDNEPMRRAFIECCSEMGYATEPPHCARYVERVKGYQLTCRRRELGSKLVLAASDPEEWEAITAEIAKIENEAHGASRSLMERGVNHYPTETPPETILLGNGWMRRGDVATFISTAGAGKSVAVTQAAMCWGLGLPYLGIVPPRPLRVILFSGEDDGVTIGQCREGLLEHSEAITGRKLSAKDLEPLYRMLRTEFIREHVGHSFHPHLATMLREEAADLIIVNPLLSYLGGEVVGCVSEWIRAGLMPILQSNGCASLLAHHTPKLAKDGWENTDDTYSGIGGAEIANIPRSILTMRPTAAKGLFVVNVSKRQTTGWKDDSGSYCAHYFVKRTDNPERPAWLPVGTDEAEDMIAEGKPAQSKRQAGATKKVQHGDVVNIVRPRPVAQQDLIARLVALRGCSERTARDAIIEAEVDEIESFDERNPKGGKAIKWLRMNPEHPQLAK
jgi:hypothetical protein